MLSIVDLSTLHGQGLVGQGLVGQGLVGQGLVGQGLVGQGLVGFSCPLKVCHAYGLLVGWWNVAVLSRYILTPIVLGGNLLSFTPGQVSGMLRLPRQTVLGWS